MVCVHGSAGDSNDRVQCTQYNISPEDPPFCSRLIGRMMNIIHAWCFRVWCVLPVMGFPRLYLREWESVDFSVAQVWAAYLDLYRYLLG